MQSSNGGSAGLSDIWQAAVARYEARTGVRLRLMSSAQGVDGVLSHIQGNKEMFKKKRHNGSHLQEWRSWLKSSFESIDALGKIVAHATKGVSIIIRPSLHFEVVLMKVFLRYSLQAKPYSGQCNIF
jgi:hypothetical protein